MGIDKMVAHAGPEAPEALLIDHLLTVARDRLGMELSWMSSFSDGMQNFDRVSGDVDAFDIRVGDSLPLAGSYCLRVNDGRLPNIIADTSCNPITAPLDVTTAAGLGSYIGVPITTDGRIAGMLCCVSRGTSHHLSDDDTRTLRLIAQLIGEILIRESPRRRRDRQILDRVTATIATGAMQSVFQPIVEVKTGEVIGVEALTRFSEAPSRPDVWFAEAASVGIGVELEIAAIDSALRRLPELPQTHFMTLNASPSTINDPRLIEILSGSEPTRCVVEVTEHATVDDYETLGRSLRSLRDIGVRIAVDDVGAGFASLAHVLELQPTILKIDRSIVKGIHSDTARQALAQAIMGVAERLDATVIAEGIEVSAELDALAALGVHHAQGFLLGHPKTAFPDSSRVIVAASASSDATALLSSDGQDLAVRRFELAMFHSPVGMAIVGVDGSFIHVNPAYASLVGRDSREFDELDFRAITHPDDLEECDRLVTECLDGVHDDYRIEKRFLLPDGSAVWGDASVVLVKSSAGTPMYFISQVQDISDRHQREDDLAERATTDHLTAIPNRASASERLDDLAAAATPFGVLSCDLRNFKQINDTFGHRAGDQVLTAVAQRLKRMTRSADHVSRWGGDEFLLIVPHADEDSLDKLATRVAAAVAQPVDLHPGDLTTTPTITIGTACFGPGSADTVDAVLHRADRDMYQQRDRQIPVVR